MANKPKYIHPTDTSLFELLKEMQLSDATARRAAAALHQEHLEEMEPEVPELPEDEPLPMGGFLDDIQK
jgi:hypothetical protein